MSSWYLVVEEFQAHNNERYMRKPRPIREKRDRSSGDELLMLVLPDGQYKVAYMLGGRCKERELLSKVFETQDLAAAFFDKQVQRYMSGRRK